MKLFTRNNKKIMHDGVWGENPVSWQALGICSVLAVTVQLKTALVMGCILVFVMALSNTIISLLRKRIPSRIRIIVQLSVIATLVILADQILKAYVFDISKQLSIFVGLVITNCIVMGRAEGFAMNHPPLKSLIDGVANACGYAWILIGVAFFRELLGSGTLFGVAVIPQQLYDMGYSNCGIFVLAPGAFFILGVMIWIQRAVGALKRKA
ncbi:NADH:ubiquinone reductase (Na(+)-transporting) subunit D [Candidatus Omnitrophota bacterium]